MILHATAYHTVLNDNKVAVKSIQIAQAGKGSAF